MINYRLKIKKLVRNWSLLMLASGCFSSFAAGYSPQVGQLHPDFTMPNIVDNKPVSLSQFRGKKVLLVHFASW
jgi:hypothetical protein